MVFLGATRGMGRALARLMAQRGDALFLLGRNREDLERSARDLEVVAVTAKIGFSHCDLSDKDSIAPALGEAWEALSGFDAVVVTAGIYAGQEQLESDLEVRDRLLRINFCNAIHFCEEARQHLLERGGGTLCVFGSVSGDRPRKNVIIYGATKAGLGFYLQGLDLKFRSQGLRTVLVKPGFVRTSMTADLDPPPFTGEPETVARRVLKAIDRGRPVVYAPGIWRWIMLVIRSLPRAVLRRSEF
ncbi:MAG: SDR family NAD(P)-dependent oxidoreductase [Planctomycetota bacterium]